MRPFERLIRGSSFRLAAAQSLLFLCVFLAVGGVSLALIRRAEFAAAHAELDEVEDDITDLLISKGVPALIARTGGHGQAGRDFRLEDPQGRVLAGGLPAAPPPAPGAAHGPHAKYWTDYRAQHGGEIVALVRQEEVGGLRLTVGEYLSVRERQDDGLLLAVILIAGLAAGGGVVGGLLVSRSTQRRIDQISAAVGRYADGARDERIPTRPQGATDHEELVRAINSMMDRENRLIGSLRQATSAIAHDLRRPLAHHNQEIARALGGPADAKAYRMALLAASERTEEVLKTFQSLLHIAELEAGAPGLPLEQVDVGVVAARVVDAYRPLAEEGGRRLSLDLSDEGLVVAADPRVLGRALSNLVENALGHTPAGTSVRVVVDGAQRRFVVEDNGPGVPAAARERIFERFFRLDASRSSPGNGLGLPLAAAAVHAFGGRLTAEDAGPGLRLIADFG